MWRPPPTAVAKAPLSAFGVHDGGGDYQPRDYDGDITRALRSRRPLTLVHGGRLAGSSRALAEAARRHLPDHVLLVPIPDPGVPLTQFVAAAARRLRHGDRAVLWLDALTPGLLEQIDARLLSTLPEGLRICATADTEVVTGSHVPAPVTSALSQHAEIVAASGRTRKGIEERDRVAEALTTATIEQRAVLRIITDWGRIGMPGRLDRGLLRRLHGATPDLSWARSTRLVEELPGGHLRPHPLLAVVTEGSICDAVWRHACDTLDGATRLRVALSAYDRGEVSDSRKWCAELAATGDPALAPVMLLLGSMTLDEGDTKAARAWWRRTVDTDHPESAPPAMKALGDLDREDMEWDLARYWYHRALGTGHSDVAMSVMLGLAKLEEEAGDPEAARHWRQQVRRLR
ncbi:hypothetical protein Ahu01nite_072530 [Winogradskya humida]|uniref:Tetratricopeptide repeat protein n=1 Tax=Winogradskya humida TaxID=113566 RepID=A0ABQ3ZZY1_9ACTN|nr:hypothetical protein Ahu01nite_072530 [Actinoplanes humidus]